MSVTAALVAKVDDTLNPAGTASDQLVLVRPLTVNRRDAQHGNVAIKAEVSATTTSWGGRKPLYLDGVVRVDITASEYDTMAELARKLSLIHI